MFTIALVSFLGFLSDGSFEDNFDTIDTKYWNVSDWAAPGNLNQNNGMFEIENVSIVDGYLRLELNQYVADDGSIISLGGELSSVYEFGYGTYEFRMRSGSTSETPYGIGDNVSGGVSASFTYQTDAITEIDIEFEGQNTYTHLLSWVNGTRQNWAQLDLGITHDRFYTYRIIWSEESIVFFRDSIEIGRHSGNIPSIPSPMFFNHWGTNNRWWGGIASPGVSRYMFVDYFRFEPLQ